MLEYTEFDQKGERLVCEMGKKHPEMYLTIKVKRFKSGETITVEDSENETAFLILKGEAEIKWLDKKEKWCAADLSKKLPTVFTCHATSR